MTKVTLKIEGMSCGHCVKAVTEALKGLAGVTDAEVSIGSATVTFDPGQVSLDRIKAAVEEEGYRVVSAG
ncbi:MAG: cation transporter [Firmicutes bacterium]|nr:cation transporter [Bacillota bacterium]